GLRRRLAVAVVVGVVGLGVVVGLLVAVRGGGDVAAALVGQGRGRAEPTDGAQGDDGSRGDGDAVGSGAGAGLQAGVRQLGPDRRAEGHAVRARVPEVGAHAGTPVQR